MRANNLYLSLVTGLLLLLSACSMGVNGVPEPQPAPKSSIDNGRRLIARYGCGSCHSIPGIPGADSKAAPPLNDFYERTYIAGMLPNTRENLIQWLQDPQKIDPGNAMPSLGVTRDEARDMVAYLYHLPGLDDLLKR
jgi:cytochrome c